MVYKENKGQFVKKADDEISKLKLLLKNSEIKHIGSSAIFGALSNGIIDILVGADENNINDALKVLENFGYKLVKKEDKEIYLDKVQNEDIFHLILTEKNSEKWCKDLKFNLDLLENKDDLSRYNLLKQQNIEHTIFDLSKQKSDFQSSILNKINRDKTGATSKKYSFDDLVELSKKYEVPINDLLFIFLNISGLKTKIDFPRLRMRVKLVDSNEVFYFGLANRPQSQFELIDKKIYFSGKHIADIVFLENDDCASSYFRKNKTVLTLNSNRRSTCTGCKFCPNNLELNSDDLNLDTEEKLKNHFKMLFQGIGKSDLSFLERLTVCTGCFNSEEKAVDHLILVEKVATSLGFNGVLHYIGSEIQSESAFEKIKQNVKSFMITFTVECFTNRYLVLRGNKAGLTLNSYKNLMKLALEKGFTVNFIYILGLDDYDDVIKGFEDLKGYVNYFPSINLFQPHVADHDELISLNAYCNLEYYLKVRQFVEKNYSQKGLRPHSWECYRPLWYYYFNNCYYNEIRI